MFFYCLQHHYFIITNLRNPFEKKNAILTSKAGTSIEVESTSTIQNASPVPSRHLKVINRHNLHVPDPGGSKLTINTAFGSQNIDHGGEETRRSLMPRRVLSSIASSSDEHNRSQCMLNKVRESKSLDPLPVVRNNRPIDLIGQFLRVPRRPTKSLENCDKCGDTIQIIALPEDKMINNNFPNGNLANISLISDENNYAEDAQSPLLNPTTQPVPAIIRRRGGSGFEEPVENDASKRYGLSQVIRSTN